MADVTYTKPGEVPYAFWFNAIRAGQEYGVDPYLLAAIGKHETGYGTLGAGRQGYALGYGYGDNTIISKWKDTPGGSINQLRGVAWKIKDQFGSNPISLSSLNSFNKNSWKATDQGWGAGVWSAYQNLNKDGSAIGNTFKGLLTDPVGTVTDGLSEGLAKIAGGAAYILMLLVIAGVALFAGAKMFSAKKG